MKHRANRGQVAAARPVGKCSSDVRQRATTVVPQQVPTKMADHNTDPACDRQRQTAHDRTEET
jgi:hypothetical protein